MSTESKTSKQPNKPKKDSDTSFLGARISSELRARLYKMKAILEFKSGSFYGLGRLVEEVLTKGIDQLEKEHRSSSIPNG